MAKTCGPPKAPPAPKPPAWTSPFKDMTKMHKSHGGRVIRKGW